MNEPVSREGAVAMLTAHLAEALELSPEEVQIDLQADLLAADGFEISGQPIDSLLLVDLITMLEDDLHISIQDLLDDRDSLTLGDILDLVPPGTQ